MSIKATVLGMVTGLVIVLPIIFGIAALTAVIESPEVTAPTPTPMAPQLHGDETWNDGYATCAIEILTIIQTTENTPVGHELALAKIGKKITTEYSSDPSIPYEFGYRECLLDVAESIVIGTENNDSATLILTDIIDTLAAVVDPPKVTAPMPTPVIDTERWNDGYATCAVGILSIISEMENTPAGYELALAKIDKKITTEYLSDPLISYEFGYQECLLDAATPIIVGTMNGDPDVVILANIVNALSVSNLK